MSPFVCSSSVFSLLCHEAILSSILRISGVVSRQALFFPLPSLNLISSHRALTAPKSGCHWYCSYVAQEHICNILQQHICNIFICAVFSHLV
uniref:Uncharacterized protein n=1 Tax=Amblyomma tuberculatum TaxID=48802 RepID=A0A6M2E0P5_9ACAR